MALTLARPKLNFYHLFVFLCLCFPIGYMFGDYTLTWQTKIKSNYVYNERDLYVLTICILPSILGHLASIWGHYYRAEREFQHSISKVTTPASVAQKISLWERHIWWGYTVKYWIMVAIMVLLNLTFFIVPMVNSAPNMINRFGFVSGFFRCVGNSSGYTVVVDCGMILFLVLRRSMLHAIGFTYSEIIPLHRWLGALIVGWSTVHAIGYIIYMANEHELSEDINFYDLGRGTMNMMGVFAYGAVCLLGLGAIPWVRRKFYYLFMASHRFLTIVFFVGMMTHYPSPMLWYYLLPTFILFLVDRFIPKMIQAHTIEPLASCSYNKDADIIRMVFRSNQPIKPYYPGDYITVQVPEIGTLYHPFTIASYWAEDPYTMTLYIRAFDSKFSWTRALANQCGTTDKRIRVRANLDGVFGDRRHDYLKSKVMIIFVAGAAITTFMALIKAIAAQIDSSKEPLRMQLHLICTFRTRSELHAYGNFLHQITRDSRFTSWLHVEIYVSRPDKSVTLMGSHAHVVKNDIQVPSKSNLAKSAKKSKRFASIKRTGSRLKRALSGRTLAVNFAEDAVVVVGRDENEKNVEDGGDDGIIQETQISKKRQSSSSSSSSSANDSSPTTSTSEATTTNNSGSATPRRPESILTLAEIQEEKETEPQDSVSALDEKNLSKSTPTLNMTYLHHRLPTFQASHSVAVATHLAKLDLAVSAFIILIPLAAWCIGRTVSWEGSDDWCSTTKLRGLVVTTNCRWAYALIPGVINIVVASIIGYLAIFIARKALARRGRANKDVETGITTEGVPYPDLALEEDKTLGTEDGNWDEGDVVYTRGRLDVKACIQQFVDAGVGHKEEGEGLVAVFGGGPDGFVDMVEKLTKKANWVTDFHRETWAP